MYKFVIPSLTEWEFDTDQSIGPIHLNLKDYEIEADILDIVLPDNDTSLRLLRATTAARLVDDFLTAKTNTLVFSLPDVFDVDDIIWIRDEHAKVITKVDSYTYQVLRSDPHDHVDNTGIIVSKTYPISPIGLRGYILNEHLEEIKAVYIKNINYIGAGAIVQLEDIIGWYNKDFKLYMDGNTNSSFYIEHVLYEYCGLYNYVSPDNIYDSERFPPLKIRNKQKDTNEYYITINPFKLLMKRIKMYGLMIIFENGRYTLTPIKTLNAFSGPTSVKIEDIIRMDGGFSFNLGITALKVELKANHYSIDSSREWIEQPIEINFTIGGELGQGVESISLDFSEIITPYIGENDYEKSIQFFKSIVETHISSTRNLMLGLLEIDVVPELKDISVGGFYTFADLKRYYHNFLIDDSISVSFHCYRMDTEKAYLYAFRTYTWNPISPALLCNFDSATGLFTLVAQESDYVDPEMYTYVETVSSVIEDAKDFNGNYTYFEVGD